MYLLSIQYILDIYVFTFTCLYVNLFLYSPHFTLVRRPTARVHGHQVLWLRLQGSPSSGAPPQHLAVPLDAHDFLAALPGKSAW